MNNKSEYDAAAELISSLKKDTDNISRFEEYRTSAGEKLLSKSSFEDMGIDKKLIENLYINKYDRPSTIQQLAIPLILKNRDCAIQSKSGTGKTVAYILGVLQQLKDMGHTNALIISPTHELNAQIADGVRKLIVGTGIKVLKGGKIRDVHTVSEEIVVACPGFIWKLITNGMINPQKIKFIVVDEADATLETDGGLGVDTVKILKECKTAQKIFFSATYCEKIKDIIMKCSNNPTELYEVNEKPEQIKTYQIEVKSSNKVEALLSLYNYLSIGQSIVFCGSREMVERLRQKMESDNFVISFLHGKMENEERENAVKEFRNASSKVLITTDVFCRGMDIPQANLVVNFDVPVFNGNVLSENYLHRIGRSGRFGRAGFVIDFVTNEKDIANYAKIYSMTGSLAKTISLDVLEQVAAEELMKFPED